jgi:hypothetical protein
MRDLARLSSEHGSSLILGYYCMFPHPMARTISKEQTQVAFTILPIAAQGLIPTPLVDLARHPDQVRIPGTSQNFGKPLKMQVAFTI